MEAQDATAERLPTLGLRRKNAEIQAGAAPLPNYLAHVELLTEQVAACLDLDSLLETALASLATQCGYAHAFESLQLAEG